MTKREQSRRIQNSLLNGLERKVLVWLAGRQPRRVVPDTLTFVGFLGAVIITLGYILSNWDLRWLWLASFGFVVNWYGDSLDGTLARVRNIQRPVYGFYVDHTVDVINEILMFLGLGLSPMLHFNIASIALILYLALTINVDIDAHLKNEFKLTYIGLGPTEFRILVILLNTLFLYVRPLRENLITIPLLGDSIILSAMDLIGLFVVLVLGVTYIVTVIADARGYAETDPPRSAED